jgi:WD40 repeat protein
VHTFVGHFDSARSRVKVSLDEQYLLTTFEGERAEAKLWSLQEYHLVFQSLGVWEADFTPDGKSLLVRRNDGTYLWNIQTGAKIFEFYRATVGFDISSDGKYVELFNTPNIEVWDLKNFKEIRTFPRMNDFQFATFSPDGKSLLIATHPASNPRHETIFTYWNIETGSVLNSFTVNRFIDHVRFSPDGEYMLKKGTNSLILYNAKNGKEVHMLC